MSINVRQFNGLYNILTTPMVFEVILKYIRLIIFYKIFAANNVLFVNNRVKLVSKIFNLPTSKLWNGNLSFFKIPYILYKENL